MSVSWIVRRIFFFKRFALRAPAATRHIHLLRDGIADLQVAGEEPSMAAVDAYLDVWLFIETASSIFDDSNFVVTAIVLWNWLYSVETRSVLISKNLFFSSY